MAILWTSTNDWPDRSKEFVVNHFVTLFKQSDKVFLTQDTATATTCSGTAVEETENLWHTFTTRRRSKQQEREHDTKKTPAKEEKNAQPQVVLAG